MHFVIKFIQCNIEYLLEKKIIQLQIIDGKLFRAKDCHFPARCSGIEHYLKILAPKLPNMELAVNTRDWPQLNQAWGQTKAPVFSFSKVKLSITLS